MELKLLQDGIQFEHSRAVSKISGQLAKQMGYPPDEIAIIEQVALYHDLGKMFVNPKLLNKPGPLTPDEFAIVKKHTEIGYNKLIELIKILNLAAVVASTHHEKIDGTGYAGLHGPDIHPYSRIISVVDVYEALRAKRAYKDPWPLEKVLAYMTDGAGTQFDADVVKALMEVVGG